MNKTLCILLSILAALVIIIALIVIIYFAVIVKTVSVSERVDDFGMLPTCDSEIYCHGLLPHYAQLLAPPDQSSKYYVDLVMEHDEDVILKNFAAFLLTKVLKPKTDDMQNFLKEHFVNKSGLSDWIPSDFNESPPFLEEVDSTDVKNFAKSVVGFWKVLGRKVKDDVRSNSNRYSLIHVPNGFIIPGGKFSEYFYWDSYWIIDGLLISGMSDTAKGMLDNFVGLIEKIGFIPNSGRIYHIRRSQPPLFGLMMKLYYEHTHDKNWLDANVRSVAKEAEFWLTNRMTGIAINGKQYRVALYNATTYGPRPELYKEDETAASGRENEREEVRLFVELKSASESGWDSSSRWIFDEDGGMTGTVAATNVTRVAPVDLNAFLYGVFDTLAYFYKELEEEKQRQYWTEKANEIKKTITDVMWNKEDKIWYDYDMHLKKQRKYFFASNLTPLWTKAYDTTDKNKTEGLIQDVIGYLKKRGIMEYAGGIPASTENSGEQWDLPNAWPCLQAIIVEGLLRSDVEEGRKLAKEFAEKWIESVMKAFEKNGYLYDKYNAVTPGQYGGGGEYIAQDGFGWTNGVVLRFIKEFYSQKNGTGGTNKE